MARTVQKARTVHGAAWLGQGQHYGVSRGDTFSLPMSPAALACSQYLDHLPLCMFALAVTSAHSRALVSAEAYLVSDVFWNSDTLCLQKQRQCVDCRRLACRHCVLAGDDLVCRSFACKRLVGGQGEAYLRGAICFSISSAVTRAFSSSRCFKAAKCLQSKNKVFNWLSMAKS